MKRIALSLAMAIVIAVSARVSFLMPISAVPVSMQVAAVLLAGFLLGPRCGALSIIWYILIGLLGAPVFALGLSGPIIFLQPSFGYILGFIPAAWVVGHIASRYTKRLDTGILAGIAGILVIYLTGAMWLSGYLGLAGADDPVKTAVATGVAPFVWVDLLKVILVAGIWTLQPWSGRKSQDNW